MWWELREWTELREWKIVFYKWKLLWKLKENWGNWENECVCDENLKRMEGIEMMSVMDDNLQEMREWDNEKVENTISVIAMSHFYKTLVTSPWCKITRGK